LLFGRSKAANFLSTFAGMIGSPLASRLSLCLRRPNAARRCACLLPLARWNWLLNRGTIHSPLHSASFEIFLRRQAPPPATVEQSPTGLALWVKYFDRCRHRRSAVYRPRVGREATPNICCSLRSAAELNLIAVSKRHCENSDYSGGSSESATSTTETSPAGSSEF
jgi:hypothetical protein